MFFSKYFRTRIRRRKFISGVLMLYRLSVLSGEIMRRLTPVLDKFRHSFPLILTELFDVREPRQPVDIASIETGKENIIIESKFNKTYSN